MSYSEFVTELKRILLKKNISEYPSTLLDLWDEFVSDCEEGYDWGIEEYRNEIRVRNQIEEIVNEKSLRSFPEFAELHSNVKKIDERLKCLFKKDVSLNRGDFWWEKGVLDSSGEVLAKDMLSMYGIKLEVKSNRC